MKAPEQAPWDLVQEWLKKADKDLRIAELLLEPPVSLQICEKLSPAVS